MDLLIVFLAILLLFNLTILFLALKVIKAKGGVKFLKIFLSSRVNPTKISETNQDLISQFSVYPTTKDDIVFLGDSILAGGKWFEFFPEVNCRNRSIGGNKTDDVLARLGPIIETHPKKIILLAGINDMLTHHSQEKTLQNYKKILEKIKTESSSTEIYAMGVLPINRKKCDEILSPKKKAVISVNNVEINNLNNEINKICDVTFVSDYSSMMDDYGELKNEYTYDGVHLTFKGYVALSEMIKPYVCEKVIV